MSAERSEVRVALFCRCRSGRRHRVVAADRRGGRRLGDPRAHYPGGGGQSTSRARGKTAARETGGTQRVTAPTISLAEFSADRGD